MWRRWGITLLWDHNNSDMSELSSTAGQPFKELYEGCQPSGECSFIDCNISVLWPEILPKISKGAGLPVLVSAGRSTMNGNLLKNIKRYQCLFLLENCRWLDILSKISKGAGACFCWKTDDDRKWFFPLWMTMTGNGFSALWKKWWKICFKNR